MRHLTLLSALLLTVSLHAQETKTVHLDSLDLRSVAQGWGTPQMNRSVDKHPLSIGGKKFEHGLGSHPDSKVTLDLDGKPAKFTAMVGVDDEVGDRGTVIFRI